MTASFWFRFLSPPILLILLTGCGPRADTERTDPYTNLFKGVKYVGSKKCAGCHTEIYDAFLQSEMGRSMSVLDQASLNERFPQKQTVTEPNKNFLYEMYERDGKFFQREYRLNKTGALVHERSVEADYVIGSGNNLRMYLRYENGMLYELPLTWYTHSSKWDMSPGFRDFNNLRFRRFASVRCLMCHNAIVEERPDANDRYDTPFPLGIGCERCHGPGERHVREMTRTARGTDSLTIVNPRKLPHEQQLDICQQCHLQAKAWAPYQEAKVTDFRPGQKLSTNRSLYFPEKTDKEVFEVADSPHRMKLSRCYTESGGKLTCLTCHNPHYSIKTFTQSHYVNKCSTCHPADALTKIRGSHKHTPRENCLPCHMNKTGTDNTLHGVSVTDHWIRVDANKAVIDWSILRSGPERRPLITLVADVDARDDGRDVRKGIAYYEYYKDHDRRTAYLDSAVKYLNKNPEQLRGSGTGQFVMGQIEALRGNHQEAIDLFERSVTVQPKFADGYWRLGNMHHSMKRYDQAEAFYRKALELKPAEPQYFESLGMTLSEARKPTQAAEVLERAIHIDQENPDAYYYLGTLYARDFRDVRKALPYLERLVLLDPDYENAYLSLGAAYIATKRYRDGISTLKKEIDLRPHSAPAFFNLGRAYIELEDTVQAAAAFRRAVKLDPTMDIARQQLRALGE